MNAQQRSKTPSTFLIYVIIYIAYTSIYVSRINLSVAEPELLSLGVFDAAGYGIVAGLFSVIYSIGRLVNGTVGDRTPPYIMLSVGLFGAGLSNLLIGILPVYVAILLFWSVNAYAQSMLWSSVLAVVSHVFPEEKRKSMTSLMVTAVATGNVAAILLGGWLVTSVGVEYAFIIPGAINIVLGGLIILTTRHIPAPTTETATNHKSVLSLLRSPDLLLMSIPSVFHGVIKENVGVWMVAFAVYTFEIDLSASSYYVLLIPVIGLVGRLLYPLLLRAFGNRENRVAVLGFSVAAIATVVLLFAENIGIGLSVAMLGLIYAASSIVNTSITSIYPLMYRESGNLASVAGFLDFASYLGAGLSGMLYGVIIESFGYIPMFISWILISVISIIVIMVVNRLRRKNEAFG